ncbi:hypothetical protein LINPERPRIM_LOCUS40184 [Linum perenne]
MPLMIALYLFPQSFTMVSCSSISFPICNDVQSPHQSSPFSLLHFSFNAKTQESMRVFYCWDEGHSSFSQRKRGRQWRPQPHRFVTTRRG